jgi:hypothetical protein
MTSRKIIASVAVMLAVVSAKAARSDESGLSFWLPGQFGSFAAVPATPGLSVATFYYRTMVSSGASAEFERGGRIDLGLHGEGDLVGIGPSYAFETPVLGGRASVSLLGIGGRSFATIDGTLTGPRGAQISGSQSDSLISIGDLFPQASLKWNHGVNNYMIYGMGGVPVGDYQTQRLANLGLGHGAIDGGLGYTYLNPVTGYEFSAVAGMTYNLINPHTRYQNGLDAHLDLDASAYLSKQLDVGLVGYLFQQVTGDYGAGASQGSYRSRVAGVGPAINYFFPVGDTIQGFASIKGYREFAAENRAEGWNVWLTLSFSPAQ